MVMERKTINKRAIVAILIVVGIAVFYIFTNDKGDNELLHKPTAEQRAATTREKDAEQIARNYVYPQKTEFVDKMQKELAGIQVELTQFSAQMGRSDALSSIEDAKTLDAAQEKWTDAQRHLDLAESATESTWFEMNRRFRISFSALKVSVQETRIKLNGKRAS